MEERADMVRNCENSHKETKPTVLKHDEQQTQVLVNHLNKIMTDPSDVEAHPTCLINIFTGMHARKEKPIRPMGCEKHFINCNIIPTARRKTSSGMM
jgi:hypothetical protein